MIFRELTYLFLELEWSWPNFVVTWLKLFKPNDSTKKLSQMVLCQAGIGIMVWPYKWYLKKTPINISIFLKEAINIGHNGHIYGVKKQETNDELNQTFPKTSITVHDEQQSFDVPVVFIHSQVHILIIHWKDPVSRGCSDVFSLTERTFYNIGSWRNPMQHCQVTGNQMLERIWEQSHQRKL